MSNFNTELKLEYLDDFIYRADFYEKDIAGLKAETTIHYKKIMNKSSSVTSKIVGELMAMWGDTTTPHKVALRNIALTYAKSVSFKLPLEVHRAALILAFPLIREVIDIITKYGNNLFTSDMVAREIKGEYGSEVTIAEAIPKALLTMFNLGILKRVKRGVYRTNCWPVYNAFGILATLTAAQAMADGEHPETT